MHIVFIVGNYFPYYSAVGKCVGNVADELAKMHQVTVVCQKHFTTQKDIEIFNNQKIIRVETRDIKIRNRFNEILGRKQGLNKKVFKSLLDAYKISRVVKTIFSKVTINKDLVNAYMKALNGIEGSIDLIIPSSMPFESIVAASQFVTRNNSRIKMIPYLFDQFVDSDTLHRHPLNKLLKRKQHLNLERKVFFKAHNILAMHSLNEHFSNDLPEIKNILYIEHPLIVEYKNIEKINNKEIKLSYIGGLYKDYVMPDYLLELYQKSTIKETTLHFYIIGNCSDIVNKYSNAMPHRIVNHGSVDKQTANKEIAESNILISIAEKKGIQMSSKIFEYMSYGKPIIHFYTVDNDVNLRILKKYPLSLCLKQDPAYLDENVDKFSEFCKNNSNSQVSFEVVERLYKDATPKYTADLIVQMMTDDFNDKVGYF